MNAQLQVPVPENEPVLSYAPGSKERESLKAKISELRSTVVEVPNWIGGKAVRTRRLVDQVCPHDHRHVLGRYHDAGDKEVARAIDAALKAQKAWAATPFRERAAIFLRAAELISGPRRDLLNAATMLCQSKTVVQAEIDAACELIDFLRFNAHYAERIYEGQARSSKGVWNYLEYRPLEGFVFAATPFNFTAIAGNLPASPALMGNTVVWKPSLSCVYTAHFLMEIFTEAGLPDGVINLVSGDPARVANQCLAHPDLAGVHYTGSTEVFRGMFKTVGQNIHKYRCYPRVVGETGGKDFIVAHPSADLEALTVAMVRGAFEYQGQKCSAASRAYIPKSLWPKLKANLEEIVPEIKMGPVEDFSNFMGAVIHERAFQKHRKAIEAAKKSSDASIVAGGETDGKVGWFVRPTVIEAKKPDYRTMVEELFGPIVTVFVYPDGKFQETLELCDRTSGYALTGAVFARDRAAVQAAFETLRQAAGNFYINDKPTGSIVSQQPFGGARLSGTNDKAGSWLNLLRWTSVRSIKETQVAPTEYRYPHMLEP